MKHVTDRPFLCDGSPLNCKVFLVGFNPATSLSTNFWDFWTDYTGLDYQAFMTEYLSARKLRGVRPRLQAIASKLSPGTCLETNICSTPARTSAALARNRQATDTFKYLYDVIKPNVIFAHSNKPIEFFSREAGSCASSHEQNVEWRGHSFKMVSRPGPLWRCSIDEANKLGSTLASLLD